MKTIVFEVGSSGESAAGIRPFNDTIHVGCDSGDFGDEEQFRQFMAGALSEWYDGAKVTVAESPVDIDRLVNLAERISRLNPEVPEIGHGMLRQLVQEAKAVLNNLTD